MRAKKRGFKALLLAVVMTVMMLGSTMTVFAATAGSDATISAYIAQNGGNLPASVSGYFQTGDINNFDVTYEYYTYTDANGVMTYFIIDRNSVSAAVGTINGLQQSSNMTNNINQDVLGGFAIGADTTTATGLLSGFQQPLATLLGIIVIIVTAGMTLFTAFDLCYIAFPVFREKCDEKKSTGGMGTKQGKDGNTKLTFITDDAQHAVIAADTVQSGKSPFTIYLKKRSLAFILLAIVIFILLTGNIGIFATLALKLVQGILDFLQGFK